MNDIEELDSHTIDRYKSTKEHYHIIKLLQSLRETGCAAARADLKTYAAGIEGLKKWVHAGEAII